MATDEAVPAGHHLLSVAASERASEGLGNFVVTLGDRTHVVWQDVSATGYSACVRTLDRTQGTWSPTVVLGKGVDNHARPCIAADSDGGLHVIIGGHNTPFQYTRSVRPNDSSEWTKPVAFGVGTYPCLVAGPGNVLYLTGRPKPQAGVDLYTKAPDGAWKLTQPLILQREEKYRAGYAGYNTILAWGPGQKRLHFACDVYEGRGSAGKLLGENQAVVYMVSDDGGKTWRKADGTAIAGERFPKSLDVLGLNCHERIGEKPPPVLRLGGMVVDAQDRPVVLYTSDEPERAQLHLVRPDAAGKWQDLGLGAALAQHAPGHGAIGPRGGLSLGAGGAIYACLPIAPLADFPPPGLPGLKRESIRYVWVASMDDGKTYQWREPFPQPAGRETHTPNLERPTGYNVVPAARAPAFIYYMGLARYAAKGEVIQNRLYFVQP